MVNSSSSKVVLNKWKESLNGSFFYIDGIINNDNKKIINWISEILINKFNLKRQKIINFTKIELLLTINDKKLNSWIPEYNIFNKKIKIWDINKCLNFLKKFNYIFNDEVIKLNKPFIYLYFISQYYRPILIKEFSNDNIFEINKKINYFLNNGNDKLSFKKIQRRYNRYNKNKKYAIWLRKLYQFSTNYSINNKYYTYKIYEYFKKYNNTGLEILNMSILYENMNIEKEENNNEDQKEKTNNIENHDDDIKYKSDKIGYCENCNEKFINYEEHRLSDKHLKYCNNIDNFDKIDYLIDKLLFQF